MKNDLNSSTHRISISAGLLNALLASYDELQDVQLLIQGADLALDGLAQLTGVDTKAVQEVLTMAEKRLSAVVTSVEAGNATDIQALIEREGRK